MYGARCISMDVRRTVYKYECMAHSVEICLYGARCINILKNVTHRTDQASGSEHTSVRYFNSIIIAIINHFQNTSKKKKKKKKKTYELVLKLDRNYIENQTRPLRKNISIDVHV